MDVDTATLPEPLRSVNGRSPDETKRHLDSSIPLIALSRDADNMLIHQFADKHGAYALVRGYDQSIVPFGEVATGRRRNARLAGADLWVYRIRPAAPIARIGRSSSCDVRITDRSVSALHATLDLNQPIPTLCDHESHSGTRLAELVLVPRAPAPVADGSTVSFGSVEMLLVSAPDLVRALRRVFPNT